MQLKQQRTRPRRKRTSDQLALLCKSLNATVNCGLVGAWCMVLPVARTEQSKVSTVRGLLAVLIRHTGWKVWTFGGRWQKCLTPNMQPHLWSVFSLSKCEWGAQYFFGINQSGLYGPTQVAALGHQTYALLWMQYRPTFKLYFNMKTCTSLSNFCTLHCTPGILNMILGLNWICALWFWLFDANFKSSTSRKLDLCCRLTFNLLPVGRIILCT